MFNEVVLFECKTKKNKKTEGLTMKTEWKKIKALYEAYEKGTDALMELLGVYPWVLFPDEHVGRADDFEEMADADLKDFGMSAYALHWAKDIPESDGLFKLNIYGKFEEIDEGDIMDAIEKAGLIREYLNKLR
jgi:hypothetical protein